MQSINSLALIDADDGSHIEYSGPYSFARDGGLVEVVIPVNLDDHAGIGETTAENLTDRVGDIAVAVADGDVEASGIIDAADVIEDELLIRVDAGNRVSPSEVDIDLSEVRPATE